MRQVLRDYQLKAVDDLRSTVGRLMASTSTDRHVGVILVAPTGAGKTTIASYIVELAAKKGSKTLFLAHRKELIEQASVRLDEHDLDHGIIKAGNKRVNNLPVQVASIQTIIRRLDQQEGFNFIIVDECHRTVAKSYMRVLKHFPGAVVIGLTATPYRTDGKGLGGVYQELVECSNPAELTKAGFLVPARVFTTPVLPDLKKVKIVGGDYDKTEIAKRMDKPELVGDIYEHWKNLSSDRITVVFASSRNHGKNIAVIFKQNGILCEYLDGETGSHEREMVLQNLSQGKIQVVVNVGILTEGWDCPSVSCIVLARPTKSTGLYLQMAGRALRPFPGKGDCLILDHGGNARIHGLPADQRFFTIDPKKHLEKPLNVSLKTCKKCFAVFRGNVCPACGCEVPKTERTEPAQVDGTLVEFKKSETNIEKEYWKNMLGIAMRQGRSLKWAAVQFKLRFGHWPPFRLTGDIWQRKQA